MKQFDEWNHKKKKLDKRGHAPIPKKREIWWLSIGENIGNEQNGKNSPLFERPVLVYQVFNKDMFLGIPVTSQQKNEKSKYYVKTIHDNLSFFFILPQIRLFSSKRLRRMVRRLDPKEFAEVKYRLGGLLKFNNMQNKPPA